jgi:hypothetical protein
VESLLPESETLLIKEHNVQKQNSLTQPPIDSCKSGEENGYLKKAMLVLMNGI